MQAPVPSSSRITFRHFSLILLLGAALAACDRHSAVEVPESYGHGSSHEKSYSDHQTDSRSESRHFSDTQGTEEEAAEKSAAKPTPAAAGTPGGHFF